MNEPKLPQHRLIPDQTDLNELSACLADADSLNAWVSSLPMVNLAAATAHLSALVAEIPPSAHGLPDTTRLAGNDPSNRLLHVRPHRPAERRYRGSLERVSGRRAEPAAKPGKRIHVGGVGCIESDS